jgi:hypothetical protein
LKGLLRTYDGVAVPRNVWIAVAVILVWSLGPLSLTLSDLPDLLAGDIHGRSLRASDWISAFQPLIITGGFVLVAELIRRRRRRAWQVLVAMAVILGVVGIPISLIDEFDVVFLLGVVVYAGGLVVADFLPGVRQWCDE